MEKKAIAAGHICIDITPIFPESTAKVKDINEILVSGKLINMSAPDVHTGGSVANTGLGMKRLGAKVRLMGKAGNDAFGGMVRDILNQYDAGDDLIMVDGETTSYSVVLAVPGIDRVFLHCTGANNTFDGTEIPESALDDAALFHFGYPTLMRKMYENGGEKLIDLFRRVKEKGIATSLDLTTVDPDSEAGMLDWESILKGVLPYVDFFTPSFEELCYMLDRPKYEKLHEEAGKGDLTELLSVEDDIKPLARKCLEMGARSVLLKCGAPGLLYMASENMEGTGSRLELNAGEWNGFCRFETSYKIDKVLSATGAGDTCIAAFLTSLLEGAKPGTALENAAGAGALCCLSYDAVSGIPTLADIRKKIDSGWEKAR